MSRRRGFGYFPITGVLVFGLFIVAVLIMVLVELNILAYAYERIGLQSRYFLTFLLLSLLGSYVNVPVAVLPAKEGLQSNQRLSVLTAILYGVGSALTLDELPCGSI
jgi:uncharacterized membrane protein